MKIEYRIGDLFEHSGLAIMHGCNAQGVMGSGVAATMRVRCPFAYEAYVKYHQLNGLKVGEVVSALGKDTISGGDRLVLNAITQEFYGRDPNVVYVKYLGIREAFENTIKALDEYLSVGPMEVGLPLIGAGLANGDWGIIAKIIEEVTGDKIQPVVYCRSQEDLDNAHLAVQDYTPLKEMTAINQEMGLYDADFNVNGRSNGSNGNG
jgi:O-acetyl-ADP-ribose deacetylase (regulator of RNase III)